jgi:methionyl-tRNA synthetase
MAEKILITSALPYANGPLHFGHIAGAYLPADVYARFKRLNGDDVLYICGSDEYGFAITISADLAKRTPKEHVDIFHGINLDLFKKLNISFDHYSRTTSKEHSEPVQQFFLDLLHNGFIEERVTDQLYSEKEDKFLADRYVVGMCPKCKFEEARGDECQKCGASYDATDLINPRSKMSGSPLILKPTKHWFLLLDKFEEKVASFLEAKKWKANVLQFAKNYAEKLHARAITRDSNWGIKVPLEGAEGKVLYVWFDAPIGYISSTIEWAKEAGKPDLWKEYWYDKNTKLVQFVGKDNIPFHAVIFPAMVMGQNYPYKLVDDLPANEFYNLEGRRFSKSDGWYIELDEFFKSYTSDQIRYTIAANAPENSDSEFTWKDFQMRVNAELAGKFGNFANRVLVFAKNHCDQKVPNLGNLQEIDISFLADIDSLLKDIKQCYESYHLRKASQLIMELATLGNVYFDAKKPWLDSKKVETRDRLETTISACLECLKALALASSPIVPDASSTLFKILGFKENINDLGWQTVSEMRLEKGQKLLDPVILFNRIEDEKIDLEIKAFKERKAQKEALQLPLDPLKDPIQYDQFGIVDLRVGLILDAKNVAKSKKLLHLTVDIGLEKRSIVSGIAQHYKPEDIVGKKVAVVANLKPATLMGIESQGMILCASHGDKLELVEIKDNVPGSVIK